jgi:hypothetical protein
MGQLNSTCTGPTVPVFRAHLLDVEVPRDVAVQVEFLKANFEARFSLYGLKG